MSRLEAIRKIVAQTPNDPFPRYGLAMELKNLGQHDEAHATFEELERRFPDYVPQYLMHANLLTTMKRSDDARATLERGIAAARKKGDAHALGEMETALAALTGND
jgi:cytochrome c-type biogenesis protein CcmH/NrfG